MNENWKLRLGDFECARDSSLKMRIFLCAKCQVEFRRHGARKRDGQYALELHLIFFS